MNLAVPTTRRLRYISGARFALWKLSMAFARSLVFFLLLGIMLGTAHADSGGYYIVPLNCTLQNSSMVSTTACTYLDKQNMASQTGTCQAFLTNLAPMPDAGCCDGLNHVAYYRTACLCDTTFYPAAGANITRSLQLPSLCGVTTDLCTQCPQFLVQRTDEFPVDGVEKRSAAAKIAAIVLGVILSVALLAAAIAITITELKKRKEERDTPEVYEAPPPGGAF